MKSLLVLCLFVSFGSSVAFIPRVLRQIGDWSTITHRSVTRAGLLQTVLGFLKDNPRYAKEKNIPDQSSLQSPGFLIQLLHKISGLIKSTKFENAVKEIEDANVGVDNFEGKFTEAHFDAEQFVLSSRRLFLLKKMVIAMINKAGDDEGTYAQARQEAGRYLHTLQDFYSHSNWIEIGNREPFKELGDIIIPEQFIADWDEKTCEDCTPASFLNLASPSNDCENNLILDIRKLTSGYFGGQDKAKPPNIGKCSHGGLFDSTREEKSKGGINKDSNQHYLSPHYRLHQPAAYVAIDATKLFFDSIREKVGDKKFATFLNMEADRSLSFAIDTTDSMHGEIASVQRATVQFIEDSAEEEENFYYVLVPFNNTGFGPAYVTRDPDVAKEEVNSLRAHGGGDCPELGMSGLYLALTHSQPNSDVFYFSDASAKDAYLGSLVLSIALKKQCRIYLFISGVCSSRRKRRDLSQRELYENLATTTGGQFLLIAKSSIDDAIKLVRRPNISEANSSLTLQEVLLLTITVKNVSSTTDRPYSVKSDSSILSMTVVLSANGNASIQVIPPQGHNQTESITIITQTSTVYSVRITKPVVGEWRFTISATGSYSLQVTGQSSLVFLSSLESEEHGVTFSAQIPLSGNPIKGSQLFVTIVPSRQDILQPGRNLTAHVIDTAGNKLDSFDLELGQMLYNNSYYGSVTIKFNTFRLMYIGYDKNGNVIQRVLSRLIKPQEFEIKVKLFAENSSLVISPNETASFNVTLYNYGPRERFNILVSDGRSFVTWYGPKLVILNSNDSVDIQINLLAPYNTNDSTTTAVSISASVPSSGSAEDMVNFISFGVSVFSKEFLFINETKLQQNVNLTSFLIPRGKKVTNDSDNFPRWAIIVIGVGCGVIVLFAIILLVRCVFCKSSKMGGYDARSTTAAYS